jgi:hypothetical protein
MQNLGFISNASDNLHAPRLISDLDSATINMQALLTATFDNLNSDERCDTN